MLDGGFSPRRSAVRLPSLPWAIPAACGTSFGAPRRQSALPIFGTSRRLATTDSAAEPTPWTSAGWTAPHPCAKTPWRAASGQAGLGDPLPMEPLASAQFAEQCPEIGQASCLQGTQRLLQWAAAGLPSHGILLEGCLERPGRAELVRACRCDGSTIHGENHSRATKLPN
jgi:hypothetical protein